MPYTKTTWVSGSTPVTAPNMNNIETSYDESTQSFERDLFTAFVLGGLVASKDATTPTTLNLTSGVAFVQQTDATLRRRVIVSQSFTTVTISTTYYLDLNPDGTLSWATSHSGVTNYLPICQVTTDGSGNILAVSDKRVLTTSLLGAGTFAPVVASQSVAATQSPNLAGMVTSFSSTAFGQTSMETGDPATATFFNGTGAIVTPGTGLSTGTTPFSMGITFNYSSAVQQFIMSQGPGTNANQIMAIQIATTGKISVTNGAVSTTPAAVTSAAIHRAVLTYDGTSVRLYVDGTLVGGPTALPSHNQSAVNGLALAAAGGGTSQNFSGTLQDAWYLAGTAISAAQVTALQAAASNPTGVVGSYLAAIQALNPTRIYRLSEPSGSVYAGCLVPSTVATVGTDGSSALGRVASVAGQASAGAIGVPVIVAQALNVHVTATTVKTVLGYTAPVDGWYRISAYVFGNSSTNPVINLYATYTEPHNGIVENIQMIGTVVTSPGAGSLAGNLANPAPVNESVAPMLVNVIAGGSLNINYQNTNASPNDYVTVFIERLA